MSWLSLATDSHSDDLSWKRCQHMVDQFVASAGITDARVLHAMRNTPRHVFMPESKTQYAYLDMAVPIGDSQTISSPFTVALMTETIQPQQDDRVLEVGTGSGYQLSLIHI